MRLPLSIAILSTVLVVAAPPAAASTAAPQIVRFHGGGVDRAAAVTIDTAGNVYLAGSATASGSDITFTVVKLNPQGVLVWRGTYTGSRGGVLGSAQAVTVDAAGNVYAAGYVSDGAIFGANLDTLVVKLGPDGVERWAQRFDDSVQDSASSIAVDASGAVYVTGGTFGSASGADWLTRRLTADGTLDWTRRHTGPGNAADTVDDMMLAPNGNVVLAGTTQNAGDGVTNDIEVVTYDPRGALVGRQVWTDTAISHEQVDDLDIGTGGDVTVTGTTAVNASPEFGVHGPITLRFAASGALVQAIRAGGAGVDVDAAGNTQVVGFGATSRYDAAGNLVWSTPLGVTEGLADLEIAVDSTGAVTVAGTVVNPTTLNTDYLTIRYSAAGLELWRHRFNGTGDGEDRVVGLALDSTDAAVVGGFSFSTLASNHDMVALRFPAGVAPGPGPAAPAAPSGLTASALSRSQIRLSWVDNSTTENGFRVERCQGSGCTAFTEIAVVGPDVTTFLDGGRTRNTVYTYRVRAFNAAGTSAYSAPAAARTRR